MGYICKCRLLMLILVCRLQRGNLHASLIRKPAELRGAMTVGRCGKCCTLLVSRALAMAVSCSLEMQMALCRHLTLGTTRMDLLFVMLLMKFHHSKPHLHPHDVTCTFRLSCAIV